MSSSGGERPPLRGQAPRSTPHHPVLVHLASVRPTGVHVPSHRIRRWRLLRRGGLVLRLVQGPHAQSPRVRRAAEHGERVPAGADIPAEEAAGEHAGSVPSGARGEGAPHHGRVRGGGGRAGQQPSVAGGVPRAHSAGGVSGSWQVAARGGSEE